jgi:hypothetical protein
MEDENEIQKEQTLAEYFSSSARPTMTVDVALYQSYLEDSGLSEAQKEEFLRALWGIVVSFVELGFNVHPLQEACGQKELTSTQHALNALDCVK